MALVLRGGTLIDGSGGEPVSDAVVVIEEERISRVGQRAQFPAPSEVLECDGLTLLPGLIDAHSHLGITTVESVERVPPARSEEHTSELQSPVHLVCRLL